MTTTNIKLKVIPRFPASISASSPLVLTQVGTSYSFTLDTTTLWTSLPATIVYMTATQTLTNKTLTDPQFSGATSGTTTVKASAVASGTLTLPAATDTLVGKATTDVLTNKTLTDPQLSGSTSGTTTVKASAVASGILTLPAATDTLVGKATTDTLTNKTIDTAGPNTIKVNGNTLAASAGTATVTLPNSTDTLVGKATTDTLTNKTFDTAGTGNVFKINGTTITANTGSGSNVLATNPAIVGTSTNDNAAAGNYGEYQEASLVAGSATSLTTATAKTVTSFSLTAGDWDVTGVVYCQLAATTNVTNLTGCISGTNNTLDTTVGKFAQLYFPSSVPGASTFSLVVMPYRLSLSGTTTVYLVAQGTFTVSTMTAYGIIRARRVR